ncbi:MAG: helix-turn-helix transcriptional regulator [Pseudolysinimonas sp.]
MTNNAVYEMPARGNYRASVAAAVRAHFAVRSVKDAAVARTLGVSQSYLSRRTNGSTPFDVDDLGSIAHEFGITMAELITMPKDRTTD